MIERVGWILGGVLALAGGFLLSEVVWNSPFDEPVPDDPSFVRKVERTRARFDDRGAAERGRPQTRRETPGPGALASSSASAEPSPADPTQAPGAGVLLDPADPILTEASFPDTPPDPADGPVVPPARVSYDGPEGVSGSGDGALAAPTRVPGAAAIYDRAEVARDRPEDEGALEPDLALSKSVDMYADRWAWMVDSLEEAGEQQQVERILAEAFAQMEEVERQIQSGELEPTDAFRALGDVQREAHEKLEAQLSPEVNRRMTIASMQR